ncbi:alanine racemase [Bacillus massilinigeriensis]|uniref:alanine racemase n=1 Tax=Bacillus mediterraneensis TaxID=1805474 RepID=UPI0008F8656D|nr:alanine racemase [Bacillus mediterraneensis]
MEEQHYYRDTWAEIDLDKISRNLKRIKDYIGDKTDIIAVVKADAYGHGALETAEAALEAGASRLAVAFLDEAFALRQAGVRSPILVIGASRPEDAALAAKQEIALTVFQAEWLEKAAKCMDSAVPLAVHLKVDTGMGRIGIRHIEELKDAETILMDNGIFTFEGIFTHFATADENEEGYFDEQLSKFKHFISALDNQPPLVHCSNTAAALKRSDAKFNAVRIGISMYGLSPSPEMKQAIPVKLEEVFSLHTQVAHVKKLEKGDKVSYGATYEASGDEWIATLPIGYADGWIRRLQGQEVLVDGKRCPIVGRICMDQCMVKLPFEVKVGTMATLIGTQEEEQVTVDEIADKLETINYEVPCLISYRVPRVFRKDGRITSVKNRILQGFND